MTLYSDVFFLWNAKEPILVGNIFVLDNGSLGESLVHELSQLLVRFLEEPSGSWRMSYPLPTETLGYDVEGPFAARSGGTKFP